MLFGSGILAGDPFGENEVLLRIRDPEHRGHPLGQSGLLLGAQLASPTGNRHGHDHGCRPRVVDRRQGRSFHLVSKLPPLVGAAGTAGDIDHLVDRILRPAENEKIIPERGGNADNGHNNMHR